MTGESSASPLIFGGAAQSPRAALPVLPPLALYIHIPWCVRKCPYCDFNSHATGPELPEDAYVTALLDDLDQELAAVQGRPISSIFFGGGTPSLFSANALGRLLRGIEQRIPFAPDIEITLEANPGTFEQDKFKAYRQTGINRLSIGVQSFQPAKLEALGRIHNGDEAVRAADMARAAGFDNFNMDLMHGLPDQSLDDALGDLRQAIDLGPTHLSWYQLTVEPNTVFWNQPPELPEDDILWDIQEAGQALMAEHGYRQYEVSAYAQAGRAARHNLNYWRFGDYLGIGAGAHGKLSFAHRIARPVRVREPRLYMERALAGDATASADEVPRAQLPFEFMLNALRLKDGFELAHFSERTGLPLTAIQASLEEAERQGLLARDLLRAWPTERGFDFLSDLQSLFLPA